MTRYIFITGGVTSSLGKGINASSIGTLLKEMGFKITFIKLDPYINVDPGTMSPIQHGEVFVTQDGVETDLDLGHYERFTDENMCSMNNITTGSIYFNIIKKERKGKYLGATVQVIPHVTEEIKQNIIKAGHNKDFIIIEVGGTVGDIESLPFLEAIRQLRMEFGKNKTVFIHMTYLPFLQKVGEIKTKPTQHSVKELRSIGIQPDILLCRSIKDISYNTRKKISLFTNVDINSVISIIDLNCIYEVPIHIHNKGVEKLLMNYFSIKKYKNPDLKIWKNIVNIYNKKNNKIINIAIIGKYTKLKDSYKSISESLIHASINNNVTTNIIYLDSEKIEKLDNIKKIFTNIHGVVVPGGFGKRGIEGIIRSIKYIRENNIPFLGICLGMQLALVEFARNVLKKIDANSTEFNKDTSYPIISLIEKWTDHYGNTNIRNINSQIGGTMRLGLQKCLLKKKSLIYKIYCKESIEERHRHRYEVNSLLIKDFEKRGLIVSGKSIDTKLVEIIEIISHKWFIGCQFHPEFTSRPKNGHKIFNSFIQNTIK